MTTADAGQSPSKLLKRIVTLGYNTDYTGDFSSDYHSRSTEWFAAMQCDTVYDMQLALYHMSVATAVLRALSVTVGATSQLLKTLITPSDNELVELLVKTLVWRQQAPFS